MRLETDSVYRQALQKRFRHVLIDEYQDLNHAQYRLVKALVPPEGNICVIGDPDQAIYGFRGSDCAYFNRFVEDFPDAQVIHLARNYRSTETILEASWQVIRNRNSDTGPAMMGSRLVSGKQGAATLEVLEQTSEKAEAVAVGKIIEAQVGGTGFLAIDSGKVDTATTVADRSFADFAVLFRTARQTEVIAAIFTQAGIPFQLASRRNWLERPGVAQLLALYRLLHDAGSSRDLATASGALRPALEKALVFAFLDWKERRGLSLTQALSMPADLPGDLLTYAQQQRLHDFIEALDALRARLKGSESAAAKLAAIDRYSAVRELPRLAPDYEDSLAHLLERASAHQADNTMFMSRLALQRDADCLREGVEKVSLLTMHAAKGLEFPVVFITGCENGLVPFRRKDGDAVDVEEERRLFYVAMTRAREQLYLSWSRRRMIYGQKREQTLSPFVSEIESRLLAHQSFEDRRRQVQLKLF